MRQVAQKVPTKGMLPWGNYYSHNVAHTLDAAAWAHLHAPFEGWHQPPTAMLAGKSTLAVCVSNLDDFMWTAVLGWILPDLRALACLSQASCGDFSGLRCGEAGAAVLRAWLGAPALRGPPAAVRRFAAHLAHLRCCLPAQLGSPAVALGQAIPSWDGEVPVLPAKGGVELLRRCFPEADLLLWQVRFPEGTAEQLQVPSASVEASPPLVLRLGTTLLRVALEVLCICQPFFSPEASLLLRLKINVDRSGGAQGASEGAPAQGHRWSCACASADVADSVKWPELFCSAKESHLRPALRRLMAQHERPVQHHCAELLRSRLAAMLGSTLCLAFAAYCTDDEEGPDEPGSGPDVLPNALRRPPVLPAGCLRKWPSGFQPQ